MGFVDCEKIIEYHQPCTQKFYKDLYKQPWLNSWRDWLFRCRVMRQDKNQDTNSDFIYILHIILYLYASNAMWAFFTFKHRCQIKLQQYCFGFYGRMYWRVAHIPLTSVTVMCVSGMHHHKQLYHHRGREGQDEAGSRSQANFIWNGDPANQYAGRSRNYADGAGASTLEGMGYRYARMFLCANITANYMCCLSLRYPQLVCVCYLFVLQ